MWCGLTCGGTKAGLRRGVGLLCLTKEAASGLLLLLLLLIVLLAEAAETARAKHGGRRRSEGLRDKQSIRA